MNEDRSSPRPADAQPATSSGTAEHVGGRQAEGRRPFRRLGLTGSIGAGKSTVARLLRERGLTVLDADAAARELSLDPAVLSEVAGLLGPDYLLYQDGRPSSLNRPALAALVFADAQKRGVLNGILHPRVRARLAELERQAAARGEAWVVQDVPLLFEGGAWKDMDAVLLVDAPLEVRLSRVMARDGLGREAVLARDAAQMPVKQKRALLEGAGSRPVGAVLGNGGDDAALNAQLGAALERLGVSPKIHGEG
ncbi:dephospho-CoA kinase [Deinococcus altitudinis]|uniref:dephospho-CoA kinase n=1 Tax=Deinococcus altitudinis TaxID=468914 RepID=UPI0038922082